MSKVKSTHLIISTRCNAINLPTMINSSEVAFILYIIFTFAIVSISSFVTHDKCHHSHNIAKPSPINIPSASCPRLTTLQSHHNIHLVSLPYSDTDSIDDGNDSSTSDDNIDTKILLKKCWQWKNSITGDNYTPRRQRRRRRARIKFIPRALTIQQFQELFIGMKIHVVIDEDTKMKVVLKNTQTSLDNDIVIDVPSSSNYITNNTTPFSSSYITNNEKAAIEETIFTIEECSVISTCARMDIIFVLQSDTNNDILKQIATQYLVAYTIQQQLHFTSYQSTKEQEKEVNLIANELKHIEGSRSISTHLCLVACGLATRPDKSTSEVIFRPFDSQDAHILLQMKRSVEIVSVMGDMSATRHTDKKRKKRNHKGKKQNRRRRSSTGRLESNRNKVSTQDSTSRGRIKTLLDTALTAGKKARNEAAIPEISSLKEYSKDDTPNEIMLPTIDVVMDRAIKPSVTKCIKRLESFENGSSSQITSLRMQVYAMVDALTEQQDARMDDVRQRQLKRLANKLLHQPTMQLRQEKLSDKELEDIILQIELRLKEHCLENAVSLSL